MSLALPAPAQPRTVDGLSKSPSPFYVSPVLTLAGLVLTFNGFTLLFRIPLLH